MVEACRLAVKASSANRGHDRKMVDRKNEKPVRSVRHLFSAFIFLPSIFLSAITLQGKVSA
jgi:hypothetical protein